MFACSKVISSSRARHFELHARDQPPNTGTIVVLEEGGAEAQDDTEHTDQGMSPGNAALAPLLVPSQDRAGPDILHKFAP